MASVSFCELVGFLILVHLCLYLLPWLGNCGRRTWQDHPWVTFVHLVLWNKCQGLSSSDALPGTRPPHFSWVETGVVSGSVASVTRLWISQAEWVKAENTGTKFSALHNHSVIFQPNHQGQLCRWKHVTHFSSLAEPIRKQIFWIVTYPPEQEIQFREWIRVTAIAFSSWWQTPVSFFHFM